MNGWKLGVRPSSGYFVYEKEPDGTKREICRGIMSRSEAELIRAAPELYRAVLRHHGDVKRNHRDCLTCLVLRHLR